MAGRPQSGASYSRPVSSFYGEGQLQYAGSGTGGYAASNRDSYINPGAYSSVASLNNPGNRYSTLDPDEQPLVSPDRQQRPAPDIYGDFNNVAPKYSKRYSSADIYAQSGSPTYGNDTRRNSLLQYEDKNFNEDGTSKRNSVAAGELLMTPELGKDWTDEEARRTKVVNDKPIIRGPRLFESMAAGFKRWFEWKRFIFILCAFIGCLVAICYFLVPRAPGFQLAADRPLSSTDRSPTFTRSPAVMNWTAQLNIAIDGRANWIPFHFTFFEMTLYDLDTGKKVGSGGLSDRTSFPGREITPATLDINFYYRGNNASDLTWTNFYNACQHKYQGTTRPNLGLVVQLRSKVRGLIGEKGASTTIPSIACPIELPANNA